MLNSYIASTLALLQAPSSPVPLIDASTLTAYINQSRLQVAGQGLCVRQYAALALVAAQQQYNFAAITGLAAAVAGVYQIRQAWIGIASGQRRLTPRAFEYFGLFALNNPVPVAGVPAMWSQFGQGETGSLFVDPVPDGAYACNLDTVGVPIPLVNDTTAEAIPAIWTLAVPFYAAWLGFMSLTRQADADLMLKHFQEQMTLARNAANPDILPEAWSQSPNPVMANQLGVTRAAG